jgi:hypothetical protein
MYTAFLVVLKIDPRNKLDEMVIGPNFKKHILLGLGVIS